MLKGTDVILYDTYLAGVDVFGNLQYAETPVRVKNVLIGEPSTDDITTSTQLYGKVIRYMMGIPKGDTHDWTNKRVEWTDRYGTHVVKTFGVPITGIEANIPGPWHMKVRCEAYE